MPLVRSSHPWLPTALAPSGSCSMLRSPATSATRWQTNRTPSPAKSASSPGDGPVPPRWLFLPIAQKCSLPPKLLESNILRMAKSPSIHLPPVWPVAVSSRKRNFLLFPLESLAPTCRIRITRRHLREMDGPGRAEFNRSNQVHVLPRYRRDTGQRRHGLLIAGRLFLLVYHRQQRRVVVDDRIADQTRALIPDLLFGFGLHPQLPAVDVRYRPPQPMIGLAPIQRLLHALPQLRLVNVI